MCDSLRRIASHNIPCASLLRKYIVNRTRYFLICILQRITQYTMFITLYTMFITQYTMFITQYTMFITLYTMFITQYAMFITQYTYMFISDSVVSKPSCDPHKGISFYYFGAKLLEINTVRFVFSMHRLLAY